MDFIVLAAEDRVPNGKTSVAYLISDNWDDWFKYSTLYSLVVFDENGVRHNIGGVKIGKFNMAKEEYRPKIPTTFRSLDRNFFSVGQDVSFYVALNDMGAETRDAILAALNDIAKDEALFDKAIDEKVTGVSLLRSVTVTTVKGQFRRLANGGVRLSRFSFGFQVPGAEVFNEELSTLHFDVEPESLPPTNIHVLIGRNGVGKTHLINNMISSLIDSDNLSEKAGHFIFDTSFEGETLFANVVSVTFSAFDEFDPPQERKDNSSKIQYSYIGLKRYESNPEGNSAPKSPVILKNEFVKSLLACRIKPKTERWKRAIEVLEADPIFKELEVSAIIEFEDEKNIKDSAADLFKHLSSGHKIVLLTITRLVETVEEKSLVLLDEPEAHLHPPLLSAFIRALSDLLVERNGVGIIATHSPVVLQEIPRNCAWKLRRSGHEVNFERLEIETFGENVGILTSEIFGLEVTNSGFHNLLAEAMKKEASYESAVATFNGQLGMEAKAILRALFSIRDEEGKSNNEIDW